jgi:hypothetical protein
MVGMYRHVESKRKHAGRSLASIEKKNRRQAMMSKRHPRSPRDSTLRGTNERHQRDKVIDELRFGPSERDLAEHDLASMVADLHQRLLQANARIEVQAQALADAAEAAGRGHAASEEAELLRVRCGALESELTVCRHHADEFRSAVHQRDQAWSHHHSLKAVVSSHAQSLGEEERNHAEEIQLCRAELQDAHQENARLQEALQLAREQGERWRVALEQAEERNRALDATRVAQLSELEAVKAHTRSMVARSHEWKKERTSLLREIDKSTSSSILRREELYFTRTNLLKEQLRLRGELERKPLPEAAVRAAAEPPHRDWKRSWELPPSPPGTPRPMSPEKAAAHRAESPRQQRLRTPSARPAQPPPPNFVHGISPRSPRSLETPDNFEEQLVLEYRAASRAAAYGGAKPAQVPMSSTMHHLEGALRQGDNVARAVGVE